MAQSTNSKLIDLVGHHFSTREQERTGEDGRTIFHEAAASQQLSKIPRAYLTAKNILNKDLHGKTVGQLAAEAGTFHIIPEHLIRVCLQEQDDTGNTPLHKICKEDWLNLPKCIVSSITPQEILNPDNRGITPLHNAAKRGFLNLLPQRLVTKIGLSTAAINGETPMHLAASMGHFTQIPAWAITYRNLNTRDREGYIPIHYLVRGKEIKSVPKEFLTMDSITAETKTGIQPLHIAAQFGTLKYLPKELLTTKTLLAQDIHGWTPLHAAAYHGHIHQIPRQSLTEQALLATSYSKPGSLEQDIFDIDILHTSPLQILKDQQHLDQILGIELSEAAEPIVGAKWYTKNKEIISHNIPPVPNESEMDIF